MKKTKYISVISALIILLSVFTVSVSAAASTKSKDGLWKYQKQKDGSVVIDSGEMYVSAYLGKSANVTVPSSIDGMKVSAVGDYAFYKNTSLKSVTVPGTIGSVGANAFEGCTALGSVTLQNGVSSVGAEAFKGCSALNSISLPDSIVSIAANAFLSSGYYNKSSNWENGGLYIGHHLIRVSAENSFSVKEGTLHIALGAFSGCSKLQSISLPKSLTKIYWNSVGNLAKLESISVNSQNSCYSSQNGVLFSKDKSTLIIYPAAKADASYTVPSQVKRIENSAFMGVKNLKEVNIPDSVESIGLFAFNGASSLEKITLGNGIKEIGNSAFLDCAYYKNEENWENGVLYIGKYLIKSQNDKTQYAVKDGTVLIAASAFSGNTSLEKITIPDSVRAISNYAFYYCKQLTEFTIPDGVSEISTSCFENCINLEQVTIPDSVDAIGNLAFNHCDSLKTVYGYKYSLAEEYAKQNGLKFVELGEGYKGFPDVKRGSWYYDVVKYVAQKGYITGYQNENFGPNDSLKRQDFVCILARIDGADLKAYENVQSKLTDVKKGDYYAAAVNWAVDKGYISGYKNGKFGVNDSITREQVATILYNYMGKPEVENAEKILSKFPDANKVSSFAKIPVAWAVSNGVISGMGNGTVASTSGATRAQIAAIIQRMDTQGMFSK